MIHVSSSEIFSKSRSPYIGEFPSPTVFILLSQISYKFIFCTFLEISRIFLHIHSYFSLFPSYYVFIFFHISFTSLHISTDFFINFFRKNVRPNDVSREGREGPHGQYIIRPSEFKVYQRSDCSKGSRMMARITYKKFRMIPKKLFVF